MKKTKIAFRKDEWVAVKAEDVDTNHREGVVMVRRAALEKLVAKPVQTNEEHARDFAVMALAQLGDLKKMAEAQADPETDGVTRGLVNDALRLIEYGPRVTSGAVAAGFAHPAKDILEAAHRIQEIFLAAEQEASDNETAVELDWVAMARAAQVQRMEQAGVDSTWIGPAKLTITHGTRSTKEGIRWTISITGENGCEHMRCHVESVDFAEALASLAYRPAKVEFNVSELGRVREVKEEIVLHASARYNFPDGPQGDAAYNHTKVLAVRPFEVDGWRANLSCIGNSHMRTKQDHYRVTFVRFVAPSSEGT